MDKDKEYAYREAFDLSKHYMDKLESILLRFSESINSLESAKNSFDLMKSRYAWKRFFLRVLSFIWPVALLVPMVFALHFLPCGTSIKFWSTTVNAASCSVKS